MVVKGGHLDDKFLSPTPTTLAEKVAANSHRPVPDDTLIAPTTPICDHEWTYASSSGKREWCPKCGATRERADPAGPERLTTDSPRVKAALAALQPYTAAHDILYYACASDQPTEAVKLAALEKAQALARRLRERAGVHNSACEIAAGLNFDLRRVKEFGPQYNQAVVDGLKRLDALCDTLALEGGATGGRAE